jgi:hypothetical protein
MSKRLMTAFAAVLAVGLIGSPAASAQEPAAFTKKVRVEGSKGFAGTYTINRFVRRSGKIYSVGVLRGTLRGERVVRRGVRMPVNRSAVASQIPPTPGACPVLNLTLGPLDLNLLGLRVRLSRVDLRVEAIPSPLPGSGLLGDLLCAVSNLLNPTAQTPLNAVTQLLNALLALVPQGPSATGARSG